MADLNAFREESKGACQVKSALNAALGGVWHESRAHAEFGVRDLCVRALRDSELPASTLDARQHLVVQQASRDQV
eukprot:2050507-Amphidinium_carterae.1